MRLCGLGGRFYWMQLDVEGLKLMVIPHSFQCFTFSVRLGFMDGFVQPIFVGCYIRSRQKNACGLSLYRPISNKYAIFQR